MSYGSLELVLKICSVDDERVQRRIATMQLDELIETVQRLINDDFYPLRFCSRTLRDVGRTREHTFRLLRQRIGVVYNAGAVTLAWTKLRPTLNDVVYYRDYQRRKRGVLASGQTDDGHLDWAAAWIRGHVDMPLDAPRSIAPLHEAAAMDSPYVAFLLEAGANPNVRHWLHYNQTPLHVAASEGRTVAALSLLAAGAEIDARSVLGATPLMNAADNGHQYLVQKLLAARASVNTTDYLGQLPLTMVAARGQTALVRILLDNKADVNARHGGGCTALDLAEVNQQHEVVALLRARGGVNKGPYWREWCTATYWRGLVLDIRCMLRVWG